MATMTPSLPQLPVSQSMGTGVVLVGTGTTWKTGTAPNLSVSGVTGVSINTNNSPGWWVFDDTHCSLQLTTGATTGTLTIFDATSAASCTVAIGAQIAQPRPHYLAPSTTTTITLVGIGTAWNTTAPTLTASGVAGCSLGSVAVTDATHCTVPVTTSTASGPLKITDSTTGAWTYVTVKVADTAHALTLLSLNCHADASSNGFGTFGNTYNTLSGAQAWRSNAGNPLPQWLAYDLSGVTSANRQQILVCLRTSNGDGDYSQSWTSTDNTHNMPVTFLLEGNTGAGGGSAPASGWVTLHQRNGVLLSQQNIVVNFAGYNWLRLTVLGVRGQPINWDAQCWMDVYDFSGPSVAANEVVLFIGDSITGNACTPNTPQGYVPGCPSVGEIINARLSTKYPSITVNANPFCATADVMGTISTWVSDFPGKYVLIAFGGQDAINNVSQATFLSNLTAIYNTINSAGKTMILGKFPWNETGSVQTSGLAIRPAIDSLWSTYPGIVHGPDFWLFYAGRNDLYQDAIHPNMDGSSLFRELWRDVLMKTIYTSTVIHTTLAEPAATFL